MLDLGPNLPRGITPVASAAEPEAPVPPSLGDVWWSEFRLENDVFAGFAAQDPTRDFAATADPDHNPLDVIKDTRFEQEYLQNFVGSRSEAETRWIMSRIDEEEKARAIRDQSGAMGWLAGVTAGTLSPTTLLPIGGWVKYARLWLRLGRTGRTGLAALEGAAVVGGAVGAQEAALQAFSETRTAEETFWSIAGAAVIGGVLGPVISQSLRNPDIDRLAALLRQAPVTRAEQAAAFTGLAQSVGAASAAAARGTGELAGTFGVAEALRFQDPMLRTATSSIQTARDIGRDLYELPTNLAENAEGLATSVGGSVETRMKMLGTAPLAEAIVGMDEAFSKYYFGAQRRFAPLRSELDRLTGRAGGRMTYLQFKEAVYDSLLDADVHAVPEVAEAARALRAKLFDPLRDAAIEVGVPGFADRVAAGSVDAGYVTRIWLRDVIGANRNRFNDILAQHFLAHQQKADLAVRAMLARGEEVGPDLQKAADLTEGEVRALAEETTNTIMGQSPLRASVPQDFLVAGPRGPLMERMLRDLPTKLVRDFVERDPEVIARQYARTMSADIELTRKFGSVDMKEQLQKITDEMNARLRGLTDGSKEAKRIQKEAEGRISDLSAIRDRLRGTYAISTNADGLHIRAARVVRNLNYMRLLGGMTPSAIPDIGRPVMVHGLTRSFGAAFAPFVSGLASTKLAAKEVKLAGAALDMVLDTRAMALADIMDDYGRGSKFERGLQSLGSRFGLLSLMAPWNSVMKQWVGIIAQTRILQGVERIATGKAISRKEVEYLAAGGIDRTMAERIYREFIGGDVEPAALPSTAPSADDLLEDAGEIIPAFHGSPFAFDKFDAAKIGAGEGAQVFGDGLYFADRRIIGEHYRRIGSKPPEGIIGKVREALAPSGYLYEVKISARQEDLLDWDAPLSEQSARIRALAEKQGMALERSGRELYESLMSRAQAPSEKGAGTARLAWQEAAREHAEVLAEARSRLGSSADNLSDRGVVSALEERPEFAALHARATETARASEMAWRSTWEAKTGVGGVRHQAASSVLREGGVPGIRYFDAGSRSPLGAKGKGTRNYVIFDPKRVEITNRHGKEPFRKPQPSAPQAAAPSPPIRRGGVKDGAIWWANTSEWTDKQAVESFRAALVRDVDRVIVTPGQDKPLWMSTELGKTLFQFKSFAIASTQRTLLAGLQQRDMATLNGVMMMLALGALTYKLKSENAGYEVSSDPAKVAVEAFDRSGLAGWLMEANNMAEMATRGRVGLSAITGEVSSRYASRSQAEAFMGPTFGAALEALRLSGAASAGDWTESDTHALRRLMIGQNIFYLRGLFDAAEQGVNNTFGIPARN